MDQSAIETMAEQSAGVFFGREYAVSEMSKSNRAIFLYHPGDEFGVKYIPTAENLFGFGKSLGDIKREIGIGLLVESFKHPNLCGVVDAKGAYDGVALKVRYSGKSLSSMDNSALPCAFEILHDVCSGLVVLHQNNIVHNDISLNNVTVGAQGSALIDFGEARRVGIDTDFPGYTVGFAAPEVVTLGDFSYASDVYSVGKLGHYFEKQGVLSTDLRSPFHAILENSLFRSTVSDAMIRPAARQLELILSDYLASVQVVRKIA